MFLDVCIIAFLPHILDSSPSERSSYLRLLTQTAKKYQNSPLQFLWTQAGDQLPLEEQLALGGGYPTAVTVNTGRGVYSVLRGAFTKENIEKWLDEMMRGGAGGGKFKGDIKINRVEKWKIKEEL
jgi:protein disulfide-isomerase A6